MTYQHALEMYFVIGILAGVWILRGDRASHSGVFFELIYGLVLIIEGLFLLVETLLR